MLIHYNFHVYILKRHNFEEEGFDSPHHGLYNSPASFFLKLMRDPQYNYTK